jgi:cobalt-zinc-cadmium efflux system outer membrane protein
MRLSAQNTPSPIKDTITLTLPSLEATFLKNNFQLLAQQYNIKAQRALVLQAKLYPNPNLNILRGPLTPISDELSNYPESNFINNAEVQAQVSQLIILARKRNKSIKLAEANVALAEAQFYDLIRTLSYSLRSNFYNIYYLLENAKVYQRELDALNDILYAYQAQEGKGYISEKEIVRVKAQLYALQNEYVLLQNQINDMESQLRLIVQIKDVFIKPSVDTQKILALNPATLSYQNLVDTAYKVRTDLQIARANNLVSDRNIALQKALAVPDITGTLAWDKQGNFARNFHGIGFAMDMPFFNRNQGNIQSAKNIKESTNALQKAVEWSVEENIARGLQKAYDWDKTSKSIDPKFVSDFERLKNEVIRNYKQRNIGLLDFLDFYDSYKNNTLQVNAILYNRIQSFEDLNYYIGTTFFNQK